jgi:hypothetical protein
VIVDGQRAIVDEVRVAADVIRLRDRVHAFDHEADEAVALALHARHHRAAVDGHLAVETKAELAPALDAVRRLRRRDQQLAGHAADPSAGRAVGPALDQDGTLARRDRGTVRGEAGGAGPDDSHIHADSFHHAFSR